MTSKEALEEIRNYHNETIYDADNIYTENMFEEQLDIIEKDLDRLEKLEKVIEILKDNYPIKFLGFNKYGAKPYEIMVNGYIQGFEKEQYELLKEVLG